MKFRKWLEEFEEFEDLDAMADEFFSQRARNEEIDDAIILKALGLPGELVLKKIKQGSVANIYLHPQDETKVIKVTADMADGQHTRAAQQLQPNRNIVKLHKGPVQINNKAIAMVLDYVHGEPMPYTAAAMIEMMDGNIDRVLKHFNKETPAERSRIEQLLDTLSKLEHIGVNIFDLDGDNILNTGEAYVIVDLGQ